MPAYADAAEKLAAGQPEETIALNSPVTSAVANPATEDTVPQWLPSGRDIRIECCR